MGFRRPWHSFRRGTPLASSSRVSEQPGQYSKGPLFGTVSGRPERSDSEVVALWCNMTSSPRLASNGLRRYSYMGML